MNLFNGLPMRPHDAIRLVGQKKARIVGSLTVADIVRAIEGGESLRWSIEMIYAGLDTAIASDKGPSCAGPRPLTGKVRLEVMEWDGNDANEGCSAVMMRGRDGEPVGYY